MTWKTSLPIHGEDSEGRSLHGQIGIWEREDGQLFTAISYGGESKFVHTADGVEVADGEEPILYNSDDEIELSLKVRQTIAERLKMTGET